MARRILLADDSVTAQNMGRRILTDAGYEVVTVNNGSAALKKIAENKPDLIVLDVYMPGYGGLEVCQRVKENPETRQIPVLLTVGKLEPFKAEEARRVGADSFIIKPFEATELLTVLTKLEDKIVAQPQPQKSGRFAKALAAVEQSDKGDRFGDKETGWKNRLTIPVPHAKPKAERKLRRSRLRRWVRSWCFEHRAIANQPKRPSRWKRTDLNVRFRQACRQTSRRKKLPRSRRQRQPSAARQNSRPRSAEARASSPSRGSGGEPEVDDLRAAHGSGSRSAAPAVVQAPSARSGGGSSAAVASPEDVCRH